MRWSDDALGASVTSYVRSNVFALVVVARKSPAEKPSGEERSTYASTLLPDVCVAPGASHGSFVEIGPFCSVCSVGGTNDAIVLSGFPVGCGVSPLPCGPSCGPWIPLPYAHTR